MGNLSARALGGRWKNPGEKDSLQRRRAQGPAAPLPPESWKRSRLKACLHPPDRIHRALKLRLRVASFGRAAGLH
jgi:hypothetical protein